MSYYVDLDVEDCWSRPALLTHDATMEMVLAASIQQSAPDLVFFRGLLDFQPEIIR